MHDTPADRQPSRILYAITRALLGGAQIHLLSLLRRAATNGECGLIVGNEGPFVNLAREAGARVWIVPSLRNPIHFVNDWYATAAILRIIREFQPELVHAHSSKAGALARIAARMAGTPSIFTAHGWAFTEGASPHRRMVAVFTERWVARLTSRIVCVSEYDFNLARRCRVGRPGQLLLIRNGVPDLPLQADSTTARTPRVAMVARFSAPKDQPALIRATAALETPVELVFIGGGELLEESRALAAKLGISERAQFLDDRQDVPQLLAGCDVCALISDYEGFPICILEGMRAGLPVIASDVGGVKESVIDGETGFLIPKRDDAALQARLQTLIDDPELRARMGRAGRRRYLDNFTEDRMVEANFAAYRDVLAERSGAR